MIFTFSSKVRVPVRRIPENVRLESDFRVEEQISIGEE
uniref:Uncharacterized protein n=1 Tax=Vitis vinifera TaxID=29760 RepID=F6I6H4_VITVI